MLHRYLGKLVGVVVVVGLMLAPFVGWSQTTTNVAALRIFAANASARAKKEKADAVILAKILGIPITQTTPYGSYRELMRFIGTVPVYCETANLGSAETVGSSKLWPGGSSGLNVTASDVILGEWDAGSALSTHQEFGGRAINEDNVSSATHSTHVGGTMIAAGVDPNAHGMSFMATLHSHDWNNDSGEMASEAAAGLVLSNHSYIYYGDAGGYEGICIDRDTVAFAAPNYLICQAAGNSGSSYEHSPCARVCEGHLDGRCRQQEPKWVQRPR